MAKRPGSSATDNAVKLVLIFFISLLSFAVGTFVGKQVSDSEVRSQALENNEYQSFEETKPTQTAENKEKSITEEEIASLTEEFVKAEVEKDERAPAAAEEKKQGQKKTAQKNEEGYTQMSGKGAKTEPAYEPKHEEQRSKPMKDKAMHKQETKAPAKKPMAKQPPTAKSTSKEAKNVAAEKAPTPDAKKPRKPASTLPSVASSAVGKYTVQVASYATEAEARDHAADLTAKGFSAFYIPAKVKGRTWFRVSVGLFSNHKSAMDYRKQLMEQAKVTSAIIQKIVK